MSSPAGRTSGAAPGPSSGVTWAAEPADDRDRHAGELALDQLGGRGDLVGDGR